MVIFQLPQPWAGRYKFYTVFHPPISLVTVLVTSMMQYLLPASHFFPYTLTLSYVVMTSSPNLHALSSWLTSASWRNPTRTLSWLRTCSCQCTVNLLTSLSLHPNCFLLFSLFPVIFLFLSLSNNVECWFYASHWTAEMKGSFLDLKNLSLVREIQ
jgi:hypothetical protein